MRELSSQEILNLKWSDLQFYGFYWEENDDEPILVFRIKPQNEKLKEFVCGWSSNLNTTLTYAQNNGGPLLTSDVTFTQEQCGRWKVVFEFLSAGYLEVYSGYFQLR